MTNKNLSYRDAGVDIESGDAFVDAIKPIAQRTDREGNVGSLGGFGGLFQIPASYKNPLLVSATDGVGTKLKLAFQMNQHHTVGIDLVAMCVNDIIVQGAEPLFFLDYFATGKLSPDVAERVVTGIGEGCVQANAALIGGETAEMPGMYAANEYDLAGFSVGAVEREKLITGEKVSAGDVLIGLPSSGLHSNGFSLVRKIVELTNDAFDSAFSEDKSLGETLLTPTTIYVRALLALLKKVEVHAIAHITGGGLPGNVMRVLPEGTQAVIDEKSWQWPSIFTYMQDGGNVTDEEMYRTFNCGIGMVLVVSQDNVASCLSVLESQHQSAFVLGHVGQRNDGDKVVIQA